MISEGEVASEDESSRPLVTEKYRNSNLIIIDSRKHRIATGERQNPKLTQATQNRIH